MDKILQGRVFALHDTRFKVLIGLMGQRGLVVPRTYTFRPVMRLSAKVTATSLLQVKKRAAFNSNSRWGFKRKFVLRCAVSLEAKERGIHFNMLDGLFMLLLLSTIMAIA